MKINLNTLLATLGGLGVFAPDVAQVAAWLASMHISWMSYVVRGLGLLAAFFAAAPLVVPKLRAFLSLLGLATAPGAQAPGVLKAVGVIVPITQAREPDPDSVNTPVKPVLAAVPSEDEITKPLSPKGTSR
jgi:hypothetical protein